MQGITVDLGSGAARNLSSYAYTGSTLPPPELTARHTFYLKNIGSEIVYLGASDVDPGSNNYFTLDPGDSLSVTANKDHLYAKGTTSGTLLSLLASVTGG